MATALLKKPRRPIGPESNGALLTPQEFDRAEFEDGWRYELINGVLIVSPIPSEAEVDPNEELGHILRNYRDDHPQGSVLDRTLPERYVRIGDNRRRPDRQIWAGLGRRPRKHELPTIVVEFVSSRKRDRQRDYETKREEYMTAGIKEYWIIDRFERTMTVFARQAGKVRKKTVREHQQYKTDLLPEFELPLARLLAVADDWADEEEDE